MRPYLTVIIDSFREALASRVLYILLALTTAVLLLGVAPLAITERASSPLLRMESVPDWPAFVAAIKKQRAAETESPGKRLWTLLDDGSKAKLAESNSAAGDDDAFGTARVSDTMDAINTVLARRDLYDESAWRGVKLGKEAKDFVGVGVVKLSDDDLTRLNRLLLEAAFPGMIKSLERVELGLSYFGLTLFESMPFDRAQLRDVIKATVAGVMNFFVGVVGVFGAILVTASIIPRTFEAGAIDLLLSKPIARWLLFLAKFFGGCAFTLLNAGYFIVGLWLIVGLRFQLWQTKLLLCLPVFLFLFVIYYAVSALAGVLWRNAIVSVVVAILFWAACFSIGFAKQTIEVLGINPDRLVKVVRVGDSLIGVTEAAEVVEWRGGDRKWLPVFLAENGESVRPPFGITLPVAGPTFDPNSGHLYAVRPAWPPGPMMGQSRLSGAARSTDWRRVDGPPVPRDPTSVVTTADGSVFVLAKSGVVRIRDASWVKSAALPSPGQKPAAVPANVLDTVSPVPSLWWNRYSDSCLSADGRMVFWDGKTLTKLELDDTSGRFERRQESDVEKESVQGLVTLGGSTMLLALADGRVRVFDANDFSVKQEFRPEGKNHPRFVAASPDGRWFVVLFHHRRLWLFDAASGQPVATNINRQGEVSAASFDGSNRLLVAAYGNRVTDYQLEPFRAESRTEPVPSTIERVYDYVILPIYRVFPKPGELGNVVSYLLLEQQTVATGGPNADELSASRVQLRILPPIWSSLGFVVVVLAFTCWKISRADF